MTFPTNPIYKLVKNPFTDVIESVKMQKNSDIIYIPFDEANTDYQAYLEWAKTNTPEEAD